MRTKEAAIHAFFNSFGMPGYTSASVPDDAKFPYLTYELSTGAWEDGPISITVNLWFYVSDESVPNAKVREISKRIGLSGITMPVDGGILYITRGSPFSVSMSDDSDQFRKRRYMNINIEYLTIY